MIGVLSSLKLVESGKVYLHEDHEPARLGKTCEAIENAGFLRHPPLAMEMGDGGVLILDGAHRTGSLRAIGCRWIPVQLVDPSDMELSAWDHLVTEGAWLERLKKDPSLIWKPKQEGGQPIIALTEADGSRFYLYSSEGFGQSLEPWHRVVGAYSQACAVKRVPQDTPFLPEPGTVRVSSLQFGLQELEKVARSGKVMPAGVTRVIVRGRILNLNIPLELLRASEPDREKWRELCIRWEKGLRLYSESVYLCEA